MPDVDLVAIQDFSYSTRRLRVGDSFTVPAKMAKVLVGIKKAELPREVGTVPPPPPQVVEQAKAVTPQAPKKTMRRRTAKKG